MTQDDLLKVLSAAEQRPEQLLMVGFNRRFAPTVSFLQRKSDSTDRALRYSDSSQRGLHPSKRVGPWLNRRRSGPRRDLSLHRSSPRPVPVFGHARLCQRVTLGRLSTERQRCDHPDSRQWPGLQTFSTPARGTRATRANASRFTRTVVVPKSMDSRSARFIANGRTSSRRLLRQDYGHSGELAAFLKAITDGDSRPVDLDDYATTTWATLAIERSLETGQAVGIESIKATASDKH